MIHFAHYKLPRSRYSDLENYVSVQAFLYKRCASRQDPETTLNSELMKDIQFKHSPVYNPGPY